MTSESPAGPVAEADRSHGRRFAFACLIGALPAVALFALVVTHGGSYFFPIVRVARPPHGGVAGVFNDYFDVQGHALSNFFDVQGRALLRGRWDVPPGRIWSTEHFDVGGRTYIYFGPVPALLRWPVLVVTHRFDGRLTTVSLVAGFAAATAAVSRVLWTARSLVRPGEAVRRGELAACALAVFTCVTGSTLIFPASVPWSYHEPVLWGVAFALLGFDAVITAGRRPSWKPLVLAVAFSGLALLTRASVGIGPVVALALVGVHHMTLAWRDRRSTVAGEPRRGWAFVAGAALPLTLYALINRAKFGSFFGVPWDRWGGMLRGGAPARFLLHQNGGSMFSLRYLPTTLVQYIRPDGFRVTGDYPFFDFPARSADTFLGMHFAAVFPTTSVVASMPLLVILAGVGLRALAGRRISRDATVGYVACVLGASIGAASTLSYGWIDNRFLLDLVPLIILPASVGFFVVMNWRQRFSGSGRRIIAFSIGAIALFGVAVNIALTLRYQHRFALSFG